VNSKPGISKGRLTYRKSLRMHTRPGLADWLPSMWVRQHSQKKSPGRAADGGGFTGLQPARRMS
jgi:hypothetical protein